MSEKLSERLDRLAGLTVESPAPHLTGGMKFYVYDAETREAMTEAAAALRAVEWDAWRPIETAPKDGTYVRLLSAEGEDVGCWQEERYCMLGAPQGSFGRGWVDESNHLPIHAEHEPTHWRPLDAAGSAEGVEGG